MKTIVEFCENLTPTRALLYGLILAAAIEIFTSALRFGLGLQATRDTQQLGRYTFGWRIHHGYIGVLLLVLVMIPENVALKRALTMVGVGLLVSDLVHHFLVLWPITGSHDFDFRYPRK